MAEQAGPRDRRGAFLRRNGIAPDQRQFSRRDKPVLLGRAVEEPPDDHPDEARAARDKKGRVPGVAVPQQPGDEHGRDDRTDVRAAVEERSGEGPFRPRKPLGDGLDRGGKVSRFAQAEEDARGHEALDRSDQRVGERGEAPEENGHRIADLHADLVDEAAEKKQAKGVGTEQARVDAGELRVGPFDPLDLRQRRFQLGQERTVRIDDRRGEKDNQTNPPSQVGAAGGGCSQLFFREHMADAPFQAAQLGQAPQPADGGIAGIKGVLEIAQHAVAMIGTHRQGIGISVRGAAIDFLDHGQHHRGHVGAAAEMLRLVKAAIGLAPDVAQVEKMNAPAHAPKNRGKIVGGMGAERSRAEGDAVRGGIDGG